MSETSTRPYLIRAIHEWCTDNGYRPFIAVRVDERTRVPLEHVRDGQIVLNVAAHATHRLRLGNDLIEFEARFGGVARQISIPVENVGAIYAAENGQGMAFEVDALAESDAGVPLEAAAPEAAAEPEPEPAPEPEAAPEPPAPPASAPLSAVPTPEAGAHEPGSPGRPRSSPPRRPTLTRVK